jgi:hypothetical protein
LVPDAALLAALVAALLLAAADGVGVRAVLVVLALAEAWVEPGRKAATTPAVITPAAPTVAVTARSWPWLRRRWNTAARTSARRWLMKVLAATAQ